MEGFENGVEKKFDPAKVAEQFAGIEVKRIDVNEDEELSWTRRMNNLIRRLGEALQTFKPYEIAAMKARDEEFFTQKAKLEALKAKAEIFLGEHTQAVNRSIE